MLLPAFVLASMPIASFAQPTAAAPTNITFSNQTYTTGPSPAGVVSGDFNNDGKPDLAVIDDQSNQVNILLGTGGGLFTLGSSTPTGVGPIQIVTATFTLTGKQALAVANADKTITILIGPGDGTFLASSIPTQGVPSALIAADLLGNGLTQLVDVECASAHTAPCSLNIYQSDAHAVFLHAQTIPLPGAPAFDGLIVSDDFNLDNRPDIAVATNNQVLLFTDTSPSNGLGLATLKLHTTITPPNTITIAGLTAGHFNAGAAPDLAIESYDNVSDTNFPNTDRIYLNTGTGGFFLKSQVPGSRGFGHNLYSGDVNGDDSDVSPYRGVPLAGDINGDGIQDLLIAGGSIHDPSLYYALGRGDGTFNTPVNIPGSGSSTGLALRDLNLDSRHDIALAANNQLAGIIDTDVLLNQNAATNCAPPGSGTLAVNICSAATAINSVTVKASGNSPNGVKRVELWIDGSKRAQAFNDQLNVKVGLAAGKHSVTVVGVDLYDALVKKTFTVSVP
jgi:hypothetical protein